MKHRSILGILVLLLSAGCGNDGGTTEDGKDAGPDAEDPEASPGGTGVEPVPIDHRPVPQHPFLAPNGRSNMHDDAWMTDTYEINGPLNRRPEVILKSYSEGPNTVSTITFDSQDRIILTSALMQNYQILLLDPETLDVMASYALPARDPQDPLYPFGDTSGAAYFVLDRDDRVLFTDTDNAIQIIRFDEDQGEFVEVERFDLSGYVVPMTPPAADHVQMTIPDWPGEFLWFTTRYGVVGTVDEDRGEVRTTALEDEEIQNSFAVADDGVYIVSDHAMYKFGTDPEGGPVMVWRTAYDRGDRIKPGNFNQGSGTTPHLFGDIVAISDNAEPRMNILFLKRSDGSVAGTIPVFDDGKSTTENALPGFERQGVDGIEYSVIVDNNYGIAREDIFQDGRCWKNHAGGLARVDLVPDGNDGFVCKEIWRSEEKSSQVLPKLSLAAGLLYIYTYDVLDDGEYTWFLTALSFETGKTVFEIPTGKGLNYANFGPPLILGPDGAAYLGTMHGMVRVRDR